MHRWQPAILAIILLGLAAPAYAQGTGTRRAAPERGYISGGAGLVLFPTKAPELVVEFAEQVRPRAQAYATFSYYDDVFPDTLTDDLNAVSARLQALTGTRWDIQGRDRAMAFVFGGRYTAPRGAVRPYLGGGVGFMNVKRTITDPRAGDVARAVLNDFNVGSADLTNAPNGLTRAVLEANGGVALVRGVMRVDLQYRYRTTVGLDTRLELSQVTASIGYRF